jgi:N-acyl-D-aspartate/D-glutamate deacylase
MEQASPVFKNKGRIQRGADADIVIFDAQTIAANAVYGDPYLKPTGMLHVLVAGELVVQNGQPEEGPAPGQKLLGSVSQ